MNIKKCQLLKRVCVVGAFLIIVLQAFVVNAQKVENWLTPQELVSIGFNRSRVVMMNEAHNGYIRSIRTRKVGESILDSAHEQGVRYLAMEGLFYPLTDLANETRGIPEEMEIGFFAQPEMLSFVQKALDLDWTLVSYEADSSKNPYELASQDGINWREDQQAISLSRTLESLGKTEKLLVWVGNGHHSKTQSEDWTPMGYLFMEHSGIEPFTIDQNGSVEFPLPKPIKLILEERLIALTPSLEKHGGTAGFLREYGPSYSKENIGFDAFIYSTDNGME